ncbi:uncharacterized protein LOC129571679 [Sitodiplosis mosellana]|uniref:uncharacterized protein LOC129571679 n=1 Tax=Sitodiplosis mosellana TaxID=263140 RepID=UPI002444152C|nr:uncharacterized protein LOC129571679 [Sitodiplosis mosellana]
MSNVNSTYTLSLRTAVSKRMYGFECVSPTEFVVIEYTVSFYVCAIMSKITEFYKSVKNNHCNEQQINGNSESASSATQFYGDCLENLILECNKSDCISIKATLESQLKDLEQKCENVEEAVKIGMEIVAEKNTKIEYLMKQVEVFRKGNVLPDVAADQNEDPNSSQKSTVVSERKVVPATNIESKSTQNSSKNVDEMFTSYENHFKKNQLSYLRSLDPRMEMDSHFINTAVKALYDGRLNVLQNKSVTGRSKPGQTKEAVTPEKHRILNGIYSERILTTTAESAEIVARKKKLNKYIKDAIHNITKSVDSKDLEKETCQRLADKMNE